jgi:hypothetical protein
MGIAYKIVFQSIQKMSCYFAWFKLCWQLYCLFLSFKMEYAVLKQRTGDQTTQTSWKARNKTGYGMTRFYCKWKT